VTNRKNKSVSTYPTIVFWVVPHNFLEQQVRSWGKTYGSSWVAVSDLFDRVGRKNLGGLYC
jgi:hypothetical protein